jgi:sarcosine oxidase
MRTEHRAIVLGLGGIGSAAAYWLARRFPGEVLGVEQFELGHARGSSEDHSRIIRLAYHTPAYVELAKHAYTAWDVVQAEGAEEVIMRTGGLDMAPPGAAIGLDGHRTSMRAAGVAFEELDAGEIMRRWPQWRLPGDVTGLFQPDAGIAMASRANGLHRRLAEENGALLLDKTAVTAIHERPDGVEVTAGGLTHHCEQLVVAAGPWSRRLVSYLGTDLPLEVSQEQVVYFTPGDAAAFAPERFPIWIWMDVPAWYGFPIFGEPAVKAAWDRCEVIVEPETRTFDPDEKAVAMLRAFLADHLPHADAGIHLVKTCLYTLTPDRDFVVDHVPGSDRIWMAVGSGHAFKFASLIGRSLAELAFDGSAAVDLTPFSSTRAVLQDPDPQRHYVI